MRKSSLVPQSGKIKDQVFRVQMSLIAAKRQNKTPEFYHALVFELPFFYRSYFLLADYGESYAATVENRRKK